MSHSSNYHETSDQHVYIVNALEDNLGVDVLEPVRDKDVAFAETLGLFASYLLDPHIFVNITQPILEEHIEDGLVGELQGGNASSSIYRVSILEREDDNEYSIHNDRDGCHHPFPTTPMSKLINEFTKVHRKAASTLTISHLRQYMLQMCNDPRRQQRGGGGKNHDDNHPTYSRLDNFMLILSNGPIQGQVRHIDHIDPNVQVCLYMSQDCPSTIFYDMQEPTSSTSSITNVTQLLQFWEQQQEEEEYYGDDTNNEPYHYQQPMPELIRTMLIELQYMPIQSQPHLRYFHSSWKTIDQQLQHFGILYQNVSQPYALTQCHPGTTILAQGNHVHAGPPCNIPRMFAYGIGIPDPMNDHSHHQNDQSQKSSSSKKQQQKRKKKKNIVGNTDHEDNIYDTSIQRNDGEIQYNPVLLHVDLCCIVFTHLMMSSRSSSCSSEKKEKAKKKCRSIINHGSKHNNENTAKEGYPEDSAKVLLTQQQQQEVEDSKRYLLYMLPCKIQQYPHESYERLLEDCRLPLRKWLGELVNAVSNSSISNSIQQEKNHSNDRRSRHRRRHDWSLWRDDPAVALLIEQAVMSSSTIFVSPDVDHYHSATATTTALLPTMTRRQYHNNNNNNHNNNNLLREEKMLQQRKKKKQQGVDTISRRSNAIAGRRKNN